jgi:hypothetical protein
MLDSGNFVLYNNSNSVIWESFDHPTDTILGGQNLFMITPIFWCLAWLDQTTQEDVFVSRCRVMETLFATL